MSPSRTRTLLIATALVWLVAYAAWTADWIIQPMPHLLARSLRRIPMSLLGISLCLGMAAILSRIVGGFGRRAVTGIMLCACCTPLYSAIGVVVFSVITPLWGPIGVKDVLTTALTQAWVFLAWLALYFAISADADARDARVALADARTAEQLARNHALAQQINPHFLFNALNALSGLILEGDVRRAERVTLALSNLLRRSLERDTGDLVTLAEEIEAVRRYLEIEEVRFEGRFRFVDAVPKPLRERRVPPLILQPLVENAIKHGVSRSINTVTLMITAAVDGAMLGITVSDDAVIASGSTVPGTGLGQQIARERAKLHHGGTATLECGPLTPNGYSCRLTLPA